MYGGYEDPGRLTDSRSVETRRVKIYPSIDDCLKIIRIQIKITYVRIVLDKIQDKI